MKAESSSQVLGLHTFKDFAFIDTIYVNTSICDPIYTLFKNKFMHPCPLTHKVCPKH